MFPCLFYYSFGGSDEPLGGVPSHKKQPRGGERGETRGKHRGGGGGGQKWDEKEAKQQLK